MNDHANRQVAEARGRPPPYAALAAAVTAAQPLPPGTVFGCAALIPVGRKFITDEASPFYPPRARWYGVIFSLGDMVRRRLALDRLALPRTMRIGELIAGFFVPGLAVWLRGPRLWGRAAVAGSAMLLFIFIVWLGYPFANCAFGLMISLHSTGFVYYCTPLLANESFRSRLAFTVMTLLALGLIIYVPLRSVVQNHWLTPLRMNGLVFVVHHVSKPDHIRRGELVAYSLDEDAIGQNYHGGTVLLRNSVSLGPVLALPGDVVSFSTDSFTVNDIRQARLPHMPVSGELTVAENHWFIWPNLGISQHGNVGEARISEAMLGLSNVAQKNFVGKPFQRWFWRRQILP